MIEKSQLAASEIAAEEVLNTTTVTKAVSRMGSLRVSRLVITDRYGIAIYDSASDTQQGKYMLLPEIVQSLDGNDVFSWSYHDGTMQSRAATPIISYDTLIGCVYMMEYDAEQGVLMKTLQNNTLNFTAMVDGNNPQEKENLTKKLKKLWKLVEDYHSTTQI